MWSLSLPGIEGETAWVSREVIFVWPRPAGKAHNRCSLCRVRPPNYLDCITAPEGWPKLIGPGILQAPSLPSVDWDRD